MIVRVHTRNTITFKNHFIRRVEDEFGNEFVLIDNPHNEVENAAALMTVLDFPYSSIADAKRAIKGEPMIYVDGDVYEYRKEEYLKRFK